MNFVILILAIFFHVLLFSKNLDAENILEFAESGNERQINLIFDSAYNMSISQGNSFLNKLAYNVREKFGNEVEFFNLQETLWEIIDSQEGSKHQKTYIKQFFSKILNESVNPATNLGRQKNFNLSKHFGMYPLITYVNPLFWYVAEISNGIVIGAVETLAGALLWLTPFRTVGTGMMVDGVRRMLNAVQDLPVTKELEAIH